MPDHNISLKIIVWSVHSWVLYKSDLRISTAYKNIVIIRLKHLQNIE